MNNSETHLYFLKKHGLDLDAFQVERLQKCLTPPNGETVVIDSSAASGVSLNAWMFAHARALQEPHTILYFHPVFGAAKLFFEKFSRYRVKGKFEKTATHLSFTYPNGSKIITLVPSVTSRRPDSAFIRFGTLIVEDWTKCPDDTINYTLMGRCTQDVKNGTRVLLCGAPPSDPKHWSVRFYHREKKALKMRYTYRSWSPKFSDKRMSKKILDSIRKSMSKREYRAEILCLWPPLPKTEQEFDPLRLRCAETISKIRELMWEVAKTPAKPPQIDKLVDAFLAWPLPGSVCSDGCVTTANYPGYRSGTNLLSATEARQMFEHVFAETAGEVATPPKTVRQFLTHRKNCAAIGVDEASVPTPPAGEGWTLVSANGCGYSNAFFYFWERNAPEGEPLPHNEFPA